MLRKFLQKWLDLRGRVKSSLAHSLFGERLFHKDLWHISRKSLARGVALGLFVAFTPTFPFQTVIAAAAALFLRVNLPAAILVSFVMNPITAVPIYALGLKTGEMILEGFLGSRTFGLEDERFVLLLRSSIFLWCGTLCFSFLASISGYFFTDGIWRFLVVSQWKKRSRASQ